MADGSVGFGVGVISFPIRLNFGVQSFSSVGGFSTCVCVWNEFLDLTWVHFRYEGVSCASTSMTVFVRPGQKLCPLTGCQNLMTNKLTARGEIEIKGSLHRNWGKFTEIATNSGPSVPFFFYQFSRMALRRVCPL